MNQSVERHESQVLLVAFPTKVDQFQMSSLLIEMGNGYIEFGIAPGSSLTNLNSHDQCKW